MNLFTRIANVFRAQAPAHESPKSFPDGLVVSIERPSMGTFGEAFGRQNLDKLAGKQGLSIYAKMRVDEQVKAVVTFKRDAIVSRGWAFEYDKDVELGDDEKALRIKVFEAVVREMGVGFVDALNVVSTGREFGYSLSEKVYGKIEVDGKTYASVSDLLGRDPESFQFYTDPHGQLKRVEQEAGGQKIPIDLAKFVHYVHNPEFDRYFGRSDLREAYRSWYSKDRLIGYWGTYMERLGGGLVKAQFTSDATIVPGTQAYTALQNALAQVKNSGVLLLPMGVEAEVVFPTSSDAFEKACTFHDLSIAKSLLVPNLAGVSHTGQTGAFSQAQSQMESFAWTLQADAKRLESCVDRQVFRDLGQQNWADGLYPCFRFKPLSNERLRWLIDTWTKMVSAGTVIATADDEKRLREILEMPPRDETTEVLIDPNEEAQREHDLKVAKATGPVEKAAQPKEKIAARRYTVTPQQARVAIASARERVDFAVIDRRQETASSALAADLAATVARAVGKELGTDADVARLTDEDTADIGQWQLPAIAVGKLKVATHKALVESWQFGQQQAQREIRKNRKVTHISTFKQGQPKAATSGVRDNAAQYFESNAFKVAGDVSDRARSIIQQELLTSVKVGRSPAQTRSAIWERLVTKGLSSPEAVRSVENDAGVIRAPNALWKDTEEAAAVYLDTVARTNIYGAMNEARYAEFTDPVMQDFVVALRYSAVLDERTTDICEGLHDKVFKSDNALWDEYRPPNHFNCRSVLIPITAIDVEDGVWTGEESAEPAVEPQEGFGT